MYPAQLPHHTVALGFVGKRRLPSGEAGLKTALTTVLDQLEAEYPGPAHELLGVSALALGADIVFAEAVAERNTMSAGDGRPAYAHLVLLPAPPDNFFRPADFRLTDAESDAAVRQRLTRATACLHTPAVREVRVVGTSADRNERFAETAFAIVNHCDLLLVACTQADQSAALALMPPEGFARGGSAETLHYALAQGKRAIVITVDGPAASDGGLLITPLPGLRD